MLSTAKLLAFAGTTDSVRATQFYQEKLGLSLVADESFALVFDANGIQLRIQKVNNCTPPQFTVLGWEVADIELTVASLEANGVVMMRAESLQQDDRGIWAADDRTKVAWFKDPDGNILSVTEFGERDMCK